MNISDYIEMTGDRVFCDLIGCKMRTAAAWRRQERFPSRNSIIKIVALTKGKVTHAGCLNLEESTAA